MPGAASACREEGDAVIASSLFRGECVAVATPQTGLSLCQALSYVFYKH